MFQSLFITTLPTSMTRCFLFGRGGNVQRNSSDQNLVITVYTVRYYTTQFHGDCKWSHFIRIPINQSVFTLPTIMVQWKMDPLKTSHSSSRAPIFHCDYGSYRVSWFNVGTRWDPTIVINGVISYNHYVTINGQKYKLLTRGMLFHPYK